MPIFKQKNVIKSYKLRLQEKLKTVTEETENVTALLNDCVTEFRNRVQHILDIKDEKCLSLYRNLFQDLESYSEKLCILKVSLEVTEGETDSSEDEESSLSALKDQQSVERSTPDIQTAQNIISEGSVEEQNANQQTYPKEIVNSLENLNVVNVHNKSVVKRNPEDNSYLPSNAEDNLCQYLNENVKFNSCNQDDGGSITEDDFYSLHSDNNILNNASLDIPFQACDDQSISASDHASNYFSVSQNSCYRSISSSIGESLSFSKDSKSFCSSKTHSVENYEKCSTETSEIIPKIYELEFEISSTFSASLSHVIDPSDFWLQIENSHSSKLRFSKSEYGYLSHLTSIKKGTCCLAPFKSTPFYYRAKSFSDAKNGTDLVRVLFIDHGSYQDISLNELRPMPKSAYQIPAQAINCYLYGIASASDSWSKQSIQRFKEFQDYCIETVVKSRELAYGVQLTAKLSADSFSDDFSQDIAQALCLDGFAISLNEIYSNAESESIQCASQPSKVEYNKTDSSLEVSGSYDINAISSDSGVSVTSAYKSSQISCKTNEILSQISRECIPVKNAPLLYDRNLNNFDYDLRNLISFESCDALNKIQDFNTEIRTANSLSSQYCLSCNSDRFCLHLKIPPPTLSFVEENMVIVMISHIVNPQEFYANMAMDEIISFDELREQMTQTFYNDKSVPCVNISDLSENMYCAGLFDADNCWYRVKILKVVPEDKEKNTVLGQYVDYGNTAKIKCCNLRPLTREFARHPCFSIKCSLAGIRPIQDSTVDEKPNWSECAIKVFKDLTSYDRCLTAEICNELCQDDVYSVLLWDFSKDNSKDFLINASLAESKVAIFDSRLLQPSSPTKTFVKPSLDTWDPMTEEYVDSRNSYAVNDEDIEMVTTGYSAKDEQYTCTYYSLRNYCPRGSDCPYEHLPMVESGNTRDQEEVCCFDTLPLPEDVNKVIVQVSTVYTPLHFYVVLPFGCKSVDDIDVLTRRGALRGELVNSESQALFYAINKHYSNTPFEENTAVALSFGTIVAAKRKKDKKWHRGRVTDVRDVDEPALIFFVDFGDEEWVPRRFIRTILPQFLYTPFQAVHCVLHGIEPVGFENGLSWSSEALGFFEQIVSDVNFIMEIHQRFSGCFQVSLKKTTDDTGTTIAQELVSAGYAQYVKVTKSKKSKAKKVMYVPG